jgi:hypothetical protein
MTLAISAVGKAAHQCGRHVRSWWKQTCERLRGLRVMTRLRHGRPNFAVTHNTSHATVLGYDLGSTD